MAGNSQRRGAIRKGASKKGATVGSGGQRRRGLEGKGPTPKAEDRPKHKANRMAGAAERRAGGAGLQAGRPAEREPRRLASRQGVQRDRGRPQLRRRGAARRRAGHHDVRRRPDRLRRPRARGAEDRDRQGHRRSSRPRAASSTGSPTGRSTRAWPCRCRRTSTRTPATSSTRRHPAYRWSSRSTGSPTRATSGAIIRSVAAFGGHGVVVPERRSVGMTASAWKTSAGAAARVPVALAANLTRALEEYRKAGFFVLGLDMDGDVRAARPRAGDRADRHRRPARRARDCRGWCARPATRSCRSRCRRPSSRSTPGSPPGSRSTRWRDVARTPTQSRLTVTALIRYRFAQSPQGGAAHATSKGSTACLTTAPRRLRRPAPGYNQPTAGGGAAAEPPRRRTILVHGIFSLPPARHRLDRLRRPGQRQVTPSGRRRRRPGLVGQGEAFAIIAAIARCRRQWPLLRVVLPSLNS